MHFLTRESMVSFFLQCFLMSYVVFHYFPSIVVISSVAPYSCKAGSCNTCVGIVKSGSVDQVCYCSHVLTIVILSDLRFMHTFHAYISCIHLMHTFHAYISHVHPIIIILLRRINPHWTRNNLAKALH